MEFNDKHPIWLQIYEMVCKRIATEQWAEAERIPAVRELAVELQVNPNTVMRAYERLTQEQVIFNRRGIGYFAAEGSRARTLEMLRRQFFQVYLHELFVRMDELQIGVDSIERMYELYLKRKNHENEQ